MVFSKRSTWHWIEKRAKMRSAGEMTPFHRIQGEDRDDVGVLTALMHDNEQSVTTADAPTSC
jgi:hypothetical protein